MLCFYQRLIIYKRYVEKIKNNRYYILLTAHWLNKYFELKNRVLLCWEMKSEHTCPNMFKLAQTYIQKMFCS